MTNILNRTIISKLKEWAKYSERKPLILRGARQVGKTTVIDIFSKEFNQYIYLNLEKKEEAELFKRNLPVKELFQAILLFKNISPEKKNILLFIDEIQNSPEAVSILRYFYEEMPHLFVIGAGSLFEIMLKNKQISFPVGRVEYLFMYPLTFKEFLEAIGENQSLKLIETIPIPEYSLQKLFKLFHTYTLLGGMPEVINKYIKTKDITTLNSIYQSLLTSYLDDVSKYARNNSMRNIIRHCIESAPFEAGKRITFTGFGNSNYRSREIGEALNILERAMLVYLLYPSTSIKIPIIPDKKKSPRLQMFDTGILNFVSGLQQYYFKYDDLLSFYKGILAEHIVGQELLACDMTTSYKPSFWVREKKQSTAEVDFVFQFKEYIIPIEVKSGKTGTLRSLHQFINQCHHNYAVRLYSGPLIINNIRTPEGHRPFYLLNLPYFLTAKLREYIEWFINEVEK